MPDIDRLPHDSDAEQQIIGAIYMDEDAMPRAMDAGLEPEHFYTRSLGWVYAVFQGMYAKGLPVTDPTTVRDALAKDHPEDAQGGSTLDVIGENALTDAIKDLTSTVYIREHAKIVMDTAALRRFIALATEIAARAYHYEGDDIAELGGEIVGLALEATKTDGDDGAHLYPDDPRQDYLATQERRRAILAADPNAFVRMGLKTIDTWFNYLQPGTLSVIAAKPGVGKTMMMEGTAEFNGKHGKHICFYHLELSGQYMLDRRNSRYSGIAQTKLFGGYGGAEVGRGEELIDGFRKNLIYIEAIGWSAERIAADMMRHHAQGLCDLAIVDYLQLIRVPDKGPRGGNMAMALGAAAGVIKDMGTKLDIPVIIGSQVNRAADGRPTMENLRNSGEIGERANQIIMLHTPTDIDPGPGIEVIEAHIEKNTGGTHHGTVLLHHKLGQLALVEAPLDEQDEQYLDDDEEFTF